MFRKTSCCLGDLDCSGLALDDAGLRKASHEASDEPGLSLPLLQSAPEGETNIGKLVRDNEAIEKGT